MVNSSVGGDDELEGGEEAEDVEDDGAAAGAEQSRFEPVSIEKQSKTKSTKMASAAQIRASFELELRACLRCRLVKTYDQILDADIPSEDVPIPSFYYGDNNTHVQEPVDFVDDAQKVLVDTDYLLEEPFLDASSNLEPVQEFFQILAMSTNLPLNDGAFLETNGL